MEITLQGLLGKIGNHIKFYLKTYEDFYVGFIGFIKHI